MPESFHDHHLHDVIAAQIAWKDWLKTVLSRDGLQGAQQEYQTLVEQTSKAQPNDDPVPHRVARQLVEGAGQWKSFDNAYIRLLPDMWVSVDEEAVSASWSKLQTRLAQAHVLATVGVAWNWLDVDLPAMTKSYLQGAYERNDLRAC